MRHYYFATPLLAGYATLSLYYDINEYAALPPHYITFNAIVTLAFSHFRHYHFIIRHYHFNSHFHTIGHFIFINIIIHHLS